MLLFRFIALVFILLGSIITAQANDKPITWFNVNAENQVSVRVDLFVVSTCPHCHQADSFFNNLVANNANYEVHRHVINEDKSALLLFNQYLQNQQVHDFSVPAIFFCNSYWVGFATPQTSGQGLTQGLSYCYQQISKHRGLTNNTVRALQLMANSYSLGGNITPQAAQSKYKLLWLAVIAALNPCTMITVFLLFAIACLQSGWSYKGVIISAYLLIAGIMNYLQLQHNTLFFTIANYTNLVVVFFAIISLICMAQELSFKRLMIISVLIGFSVQVYQQSCLPNFTMVFQQHLMEQAGNGRNTIFLSLLYTIIYVGSIGIIACLLLILTQLKPVNSKQALIKTFCKVFIVLIGLILFISPGLLSSFMCNFFIIFAAIIIAWIMHRFGKKIMQFLPKR